VSDEVAIREHLQYLLRHVAPERRDYARDHLERHGWFPIAELLHTYDPRWAELVPAERRDAASVAKLTRLQGHVSDRCLLIEDGGRRRRMTSLDDALTLVDESPAAFVISFEGASDTSFGPVYYDGGGADPAQFLLGAEGWSPLFPELDWVEAFHALARRRARLLRVFGEVDDYRQPREVGKSEVPPLPENRLRELWLQAVSGSL
jgi:hypothetical protein